MRVVGLDIHRVLAEAMLLVAYLGLNPSVHQSGSGNPRHGRMTKQGRTHARSMVVEAAWKAMRGPRPQPRR